MKGSVLVADIGIRWLCLSILVSLILRLLCFILSFLYDSWTDLQVIDFILQTVDPSNSVMRKTCFQSSMTALKEVVRAFPMVALNDTWTRLAVGDVIGERNNATIRVYDMQRYSKIE